MTQSDLLIVDLDGTLLRSDTLHESFWSALGMDFHNAYKSILALQNGRASLKRYLFDHSQVEVTSLPFNHSVIVYINDWREAGGKAALVTASDHSYAKAIAEHLGIFDEVYGSDGIVNLKGELKGKFLEERFGLKGFVYMGDAMADLPVWQRAAKAITVNAPHALRRKVEQLCESVEHIDTHRSSLRAYLKVLRPHQWLKNILVFLPMLAAHQLDLPTFLLTSIAFVCFSFVASSIYVLNDLLDLTADRSHPRKKNRPFASGHVPIAHGTWLAVALLMIGSLLAISISSVFYLIILAYYLLSLSYSLNLKRRVVVDICVLAGLYTIRIIAGGIATGIDLSVWLLAFSMFFFLSLAAVKRQAELVDNADRGKLMASGRGYLVNDLPIISMIAIGAGYVSVLVMALYVNSPSVIELYSRPMALWGVCAILIFWITRTVMVAHRGHMHDDPVVYAAKDHVSQLCLLVVLGFIFWGTLG